MAALVSTQRLPREIKPTPTMRARQLLHNSKSLLRLAYPILIGQMVLTLMAFSDMAMIGQVGTLDMAAIAIANNLWFPIIVVAEGIIMGVSPIVSQLTGAKRYLEIADEFYQVVWMIVLFVLLLVLAKFTLAAGKAQLNEKRSDGM